MKKILYILMAFFVLGTFSCQKWLDVQPKTQIKYDKLFDSETGFKNALIGAYILMGDRSLYGKELTVGFLDVIAHQYELKVGNSYTSAYNYEYANNASRIDAIWSKTYRIIANLNAIIEESENRKSVLSPTAYGVIKGEALALRAFLHLDLLRLFGWGGLHEDKSSLNKLSIPYVLKFHKSITKQSTQKEVLELLNKDLNEAIDLLGKYDPYSAGVSRPEGYVAPTEPFFQNRKSRMNYFAALLVRSRVAMWEAKYEKAYEDLDIIIKTGTLSWVNINNSIYNKDEYMNDYRMKEEQLFYIDVHKLYEGVNDNFSDGLKPLVEQYKIESGFSVSDNNQFFFHVEVDAKALFEFETVGRDDFRYDKLYNKSTVEWSFNKFYESPTSRAASLSKMPMIMKAEIYYAAAECLNNMGDIPEAVKMINEVRVNRGILYENNLPSSLTREQVDEEIEKECKKEFIGLGYMFYYYKRLNKLVPKSGSTPKEIIFTLPLPETEVEVGYREDNIPERKN